MDNHNLRNSKLGSRELRAAYRTSRATRDGLSYGQSSFALEGHGGALLSVPAAPALVGHFPVQAQARASMFRGLDQQTNERSRKTKVFSVMAHIVVIDLLLWMSTLHKSVLATPATAVTPIDFTLYDPPPPVMPVARVQGGGGGGGAHQLVAPKRAPLPKVPKAPVIVTQEAKLDMPKLTAAPTTQIDMPEQTSVPSLGDPQSVQVTMKSQGPGAHGGFGFGMSGGTGAGNGQGLGPGSNGGYGGGVMNVGGGVSAPEIMHSVEPQFTPQARQADYQGTVAIQLIVDSHGFPQDVRVVRHLGMGLDEEAIAAVKEYRFRPALYQGHPVSVQMIIDVDFHLH